MQHSISRSCGVEMNESTQFNVLKRSICIFISVIFSLNWNFTRGENVAISRRLFFISWYIWCANRRKDTRLKKSERFCMKRGRNRICRLLPLKRNFGPKNERKIKLKIDKSWTHWKSRDIRPEGSNKRPPNSLVEWSHAHPAVRTNQRGGRSKHFERNETRETGDERERKEGKKDTVDVTAARWGHFRAASSNHLPAKKKNQNVFFPKNKKIDRTEGDKNCEKIREIFCCFFFCFEESGAILVELNEKNKQNSRHGGRKIDETHQRSRCIRKI